MQAMVDERSKSELRSTWESAAPGWAKWAKVSRRCRNPRLSRVRLLRPGGTGPRAQTETGLRGHWRGCGAVALMDGRADIRSAQSDNFG